MEEIHPPFLGPIFAFSATARMQGQLVEGWELRVESQVGDVVGVEYRQTLQGLEENFGCVKAGLLVRPVRTGDELSGGTAAHVGFKDGVRVVKIRHDQVEFREIVGEVGFE